MIAFRGPVDAADQNPPCGKGRGYFPHGGFWTVVSQCLSQTNDPRPSAVFEPDESQATTMNFSQRCIQRIRSVDGIPRPSDPSTNAANAKEMIFHLHSCHPHFPPLALQKDIRVSLQNGGQENLMRPPAKSLMMKGMKIRKNCHV